MVKIIRYSSKNFSLINTMQRHECNNQSFSRILFYYAKNTTGVDPKKHSAKSLPSVTLGKERSANCTLATASLPSTFCRARVPFGTRQRKVVVTVPSDGDRSFAECLPWHLAKRPILPSVYYHGPRQRRLQWAPPPVPVPRALVGTRQRRLLCRVSSGRALSKESSSGPLCQSLCRVRWAALGKGSFFAECLDHSTRQRRLYRFPGVLLCRVPWS
jgi:hypothetical protein